MKTDASAVWGHANAPGKDIRHFNGNPGKIGTDLAWINQEVLIVWFKKTWFLAVQVFGIKLFSTSTVKDLRPNRSCNLLKKCKIIDEIVSPTPFRFLSIRRNDINTQHYYLPLRKGLMLHPQLRVDL